MIEVPIVLFHYQMLVLIDSLIQEPTLLSLARSYNDCMQSIVRIALDLQVVGATVTAERTANHMGLWDVLLPLCPVSIDPLSTNQF
jgi:ABC-type glucose/galactose transport system permease subunit